MTLRLSRRLPASLDENRISLAAAARSPLLDLTETNPTMVGLQLPEREILDALADRRSLRYHPSADGLPEARAAIARYYARLGVTISPDRLTLTASTSESYGHLFKLLCDPGDAVLVPQPSYPLFEHLAALEAVRPVAYPLRYHGGWFLPVEELARALAEERRARAILLVHPHNPTGAFVKRGELDRLVEVAAAFGLPLVCDEVFADYALAPDAERVPTLAGESRVVTFVLSGLSKPAALPQLKLGWIHLSGPAAELGAVASALQLINDTYLSASTPAQWAAAHLCDLIPSISAQLLSRVRDNRETLRRVISGSAIDLYPTEGGWSAILRVPAICSEEEWVLRLIGKGVLVHPGYFFELEGGCHLVVSLIADPALFAEGVARIAAEVAAFSA
jgi:aspartate/methionine/tyrosine aminotransferase